MTECIITLVGGSLETACPAADDGARWANGFLGIAAGVVLVLSFYAVLIWRDR